MSALPPDDAVRELMIAITSTKQDAIEDGSDGTERTRQKLDAMVEAIGTIEAQKNRLAHVHEVTSADAVVVPLPVRRPKGLKVSAALMWSIERWRRR